MTMTDTDTKLKDGRVVGIAGPVIDVEFPRNALPEINTAVEFTVTVDGKEVPILAEVAQQLGGGRVRAVCLRPTDGLTRGHGTQRARRVEHVGMDRDFVIPRLDFLHGATEHDASTVDEDDVREHALDLFDLMRRHEDGAVSVEVVVDERRHLHELVAADELRRRHRGDRLVELRLIRSLLRNRRNIVRRWPRTSA